MIYDDLMIWYELILTDMFIKQLRQWWFEFSNPSQVDKQILRSFRSGWDPGIFSMPNDDGLYGMACIWICCKPTWHVWVFPKIGVKPPKWMVRIMENPMNKWMIWGAHPYFGKHPYIHNYIPMFNLLFLKTTTCSYWGNWKKSECIWRMGLWHHQRFQVYVYISPLKCLSCKTCAMNDPPWL